MRGLDEKICKQFAPSSLALMAARSSEPEVEQWIPIRKILLKHDYRDRLLPSGVEPYRH